MFTNDRLFIPLSKVSSHERQWACQAVFTLADEVGCPISMSFLSEPFDETEPMGSALEHEHGVDAQFVVGPEFMAIIEGAALSSVQFEMVVNFYADEMGAVRDLLFSMQRSRSS